MLINFFRSFSIAFKDLGRHFGIFLGTVFVLFLSLSLIGGLFLLHFFTKDLIFSIEKKADLSVFFLDEAKEGEILALKERIEKFPDVLEIEYISKEKALKEFEEKRGKDPTIKEALKIIGKNPLPASLNIKAINPQAFERLVNFLNEKKEEFKIEKINWQDVQAIIQKLFSFTNTLRSSVLITVLILIFISCFMIFYTIRLSIYSRREEIQIMKLIGATNWFVRGPFLIQGLLIGFLGGVLAFGLFFLLSFKLSPSAFGFFSEFDLLGLIQRSLFSLMILEIGGGMLFAFLATFLAIQRYLKI